MVDYKQEKLEKLVAFDVDAERDRLRKENKDADTIYPHLCGVLQFWVKEAIYLCKGLMKERDQKSRRLSAMEWAAETVLNDSDISTSGEDVYELLYSAADVIERAIKDGMTDTQLRERLKNGLEDDELEAGHLIDDQDRCCCCELFKDLDENGNCVDCVEEAETANSPGVSA